MSVQENYSSEKEKMLANQHYEHHDDELTMERERAADLVYEFNATRDSEVDKRHTLLQQLVGKLGDGCEIKTPFKCDYGYNLELGDRVFMNYGCILLDCNKIIIGADTLLAPGVQISAAYHPTDYEPRLRKLEAAAPVIIGKNVWIGAGAIICPGVTIGDHTTIGAGSIVTKDIPAKVVAAGNPCRVIRTLD
ncbi:MAG: sugar O-acetyltransferase [Reinekea sp.]